MSNTAVKDGNVNVIMAMKNVMIKRRIKRQDIYYEMTPSSGMRTRCIVSIERQMVTAKSDGA